MLSPRYYRGIRNGKIEKNSQIFNEIFFRQPIFLDFIICFEITATAIHSMSSRNLKSI